MVNNSAFESKKIESSVAALLNEAAKELAIFLETLLPSLFDDWWKDAVRSNLSNQQQRRLKRSRTNSLASLVLPRVGPRYVSALSALFSQGIALSGISVSVSLLKSRA